MAWGWMLLWETMGWDDVMGHEWMGWNGMLTMGWDGILIRWDLIRHDGTGLDGILWVRVKVGWIGIHRNGTLPPNLALLAESWRRRILMYCLFWIKVAVGTIIIIGMIIPIIIMIFTTLQKYQSLMSTVK